MGPPAAKVPRDSNIGGQILQLRTVFTLESTIRKLTAGAQLWNHYFKAVRWFVVHIPAGLTDILRLLVILTTLSKRITGCYCEPSYDPIIPYQYLATQDVSSDEL
jgi:hypothetical protein